MTHTADIDAPVMCDATEPLSGARCHKGLEHAGAHNGWAHFPGQLASWEGRVTPPEVGESA